MEIRDGADSSVYEVNCKLNTMLYSGTHKKGLARFVEEQGGEWKGMKLDADTEARFVMASWVMKTGRDPENYRRQLNDWKTSVVELNVAIIKALDERGADTENPETDVGGEVEDIMKQETVVGKRRAAIHAYNRGTVYQSKADYDRAIYYYQQAIENDANLAPAFYNLGMVYRSIKEPELAKDAYLKAVEINASMLDAHYNLALLCYELKQYAVAEKHAQEILKKNPKHSSAHMLLALMYSTDLCKREKAIQHYTEYLKLAPDSPNASEIKRWLGEQPERNTSVVD